MQGLDRLNRKWCIGGMMCLLIVTFSGCNKFVTVTSHPSDATIYLNGEEKGITPYSKDLEFGGSKTYFVVAKKEGYHDGELLIEYAPKDQHEYSISLVKKETVSVELISFEPQPTEEGVKLVKISKPTLAYLEIIERSPNVKSVTRVTNNTEEDRQISRPIMSPIEDVLVWSEIIKEEGYSYSNIWKNKVGEFGKTRVTYGKWEDVFASFTPSGHHLVFSSNRTSSNLTLWQIKLAGGGGITKITSSRSVDYNPSVSSSGNLIAYSSLPPVAEEPQIWTVNISGTLPTQLREGESPQISSDGQKILFVRGDKITKRKQIWVMNVDGGGETQLTQNIDYDAVDPKWSPDGKWIIFAADEGFDSKKLRNFDIWLMSNDGSKKTQLTTNGSLDDSPCWNYTGKTVYFRSNRGGTWDIWRFDPIIAEPAAIIDQ